MIQMNQCQWRYLHANIKCCPPRSQRIIENRLINKLESNFMFDDYNASILLILRLEKAKKSWKWEPRVLQVLATGRGKPANVLVFGHIHNQQTSNAIFGWNYNQSSKILFRVHAIMKGYFEARLEEISWRENNWIWYGRWWWIWTKRSFW